MYKLFVTLYTPTAAIADGCDLTNMGTLCTHWTTYGGEDLEQEDSVECLFIAITPWSSLIPFKVPNLRRRSPGGDRVFCEEYRIYLQDTSDSFAVQLPWLVDLGPLQCDVDQ